jgi:predicted nucleic acid-binding protein
MRVLLDANILLDVLLDRQPWVDDSSRIWQACDDARIVGYLPASTLTDIFYVARRTTDVVTAQIALGLCLAAFELCPVDRPTIEAAADLPGGDFEDNVQIACAVAAALDAIVTRNPNDFSASSIPVFTPTAFLAHLNTA